MYAAKAYSGNLEKLIILKEHEPAINSNGALINPLNIRTAQLSEVDPQITTTNIILTRNTYTLECTSVLTLDPKIHQSEKKEKAQIAATWDAEVLEVLAYLLKT